MRAAIILTVVAGLLAPALATASLAQNRLPRRSPSEQQVDEINRSLTRKQQRLSVEQQNQIETNQLRGEINRRNTFVWRRGRTVHELVAADGRVYVMQAYAQIVDPSLQLGQLAALGRRLELPEGWRYRTRTLRCPLVLHTDGAATVIQDELQDTFQREPRGAELRSRRCAGAGS